MLKCHQVRRWEQPDFSQEVFIWQALLLFIWSISDWTPKSVPMKHWKEQGKQNKIGWSHNSVSYRTEFMPFYFLSPSKTIKKVVRSLLLPVWYPAKTAHLSVFVPGYPEASQSQLWAQRGELLPGLRQLQHKPPCQPSAQPQPRGLCRLQRRLSTHR